MPPQEGPAERPVDATPEAVEWTRFRGEISGLERALGPRVPLPEAVTDAELLRLATPATTPVTSFHEVTRNNQIAYQRAAIEHAANLDRPADRGRFNRESYIVSSQAATYCESLSEATAFVTNSMRNYEACQDMISTLPGPVRTTLEGKRRQASLYMA
ncbi:MAG: hypothetical protein KBC95_03375, partial [Candidatus Peribacteraceae bacterium]|nr:hypothetical protein [Candidatus Peribacteraceae bacterium]